MLKKGNTWIVAWLLALTATNFIFALNQDAVKQELIEMLQRQILDLQGIVETNILLIERLYDLMLLAEGG